MERTELSILVDEPTLVLESSNWFDSIWENSQSPVIEEGDELVSTLEEFKWTTPKSRIKLTTNVHKITSVLSNSNRPKGLDIAATLARAGIAEYQQQKTLDEVYKSISDLWFREGRTFTFRELLTEISLSFEKPQIRDVWILVIHDTVNHWLGGIFSEGYDRYYYNEGFFSQWSPSALNTTKYIDDYLYLLINSTGVKPNKSYLPNEDKWFLNGIPAHHILLILDQLILSGLMIEVDEAGDIEQYSVDLDFEWPKRWNKFVKSRAAFNEKSMLQQNKVNEDDSEDNNEFIEPRKSVFLENYFSQLERAKSERIRLKEIRLKETKSKFKKV